MSIPNRYSYICSDITYLNIYSYICLEFTYLTFYSYICSDFTYLTIYSYICSNFTYLTFYSYICSDFTYLNIYGRRSLHIFCIIIFLLVPPHIVHAESSRYVDVEEGKNVTLTCKVTGVPTPNVTWYWTPFVQKESKECKCFYHMCI